MKIILILVLLLISPLIIGYIKFKSNLNHRILSDEKLENKYKIPRDKVFFTTKDNIKIGAWYIKTENPKGLIILVHGYNERIGGKSQMLGHAEYLKELGYAILIPDLRGNGDSEGNNITLGVKEWLDVEATFDYAKTISELKDLKTGCFGISMGAVTCINFMGITQKGDFLIASVPFKNMETLMNFRMKENTIFNNITRMYIPYIAKLHFGIKYKNHTPENNISKINTPKLLISAKYDKSLNPEDAQNLYEKATHPKYYWQASTGHDIFEDNPNEFKNKIIEFLKTLNP